MRRFYGGRPPRPVADGWALRRMHSGRAPNLNDTWQHALQNRYASPGHYITHAAFENRTKTMPHTPTPTLPTLSIEQVAMCVAADAGLAPPTHQHHAVVVAPEVPPACEWEHIEHSGDEEEDYYIEEEDDEYDFTTTD